jgi:hypothetical protein
MQRREFIGLIGGAAGAWPLAAWAQQPMPVIGFISVGSPGRNRMLMGARRGLAELGYVEGQNFVLEDRYAEAHYDRLPTFVEDFIRRRVAVIIVGSTAGLAVAKAATQSIPIAFTTRSDPVEKLAIFRRDKGICKIKLKCTGVKITWDDWHADHRTPWSKGGKTTVDNGQVACSTCNLSKGAG